MRAGSSPSMLLLLALIALPGTAGAQAPEGTVRIAIQDQTGAVLPFGRVSLTNDSGDRLEAAPDERGVAVIASVPYGVWLLAVEADGFQAIEQPFTVSRFLTDATVVLQVALREEIVVADGEGPDRSGHAFSQMLTPDEIAALPDDPDEMAEALLEMAGPGAQIFVNGFGGGRLPPKNQIQQIRFRTNMFSAENHDAGMARVDVVTRPGMGGWRGMATVGFRDDVLNATNAFAPAKGDERQQRVAMNFSGPLVEGRTSFGLSIDGQLSYDSQTILAALPAGTLASQVRRPMEAANVRLRVDHAFGLTNQLMAQYERQSSTRKNLGVGEFDLPDRAFTASTTSDRIRVSNNRVIGTGAFNELRVSFTAQSTGRRPVSTEPTVRVLEAFTAGGAGQFGTHEAREFKVANNVDFTVGRHTMRAGVLLEGGWWDSTSVSNTNGTFTFATIADYLAGRPSLFTQRVGETAVSYGHLQAGWYLQDDVRVGRNLSLGLGVRQEVQTHLADRWNLAPRAAFTWTPGGGSTTVRGGWGIFHDWYETGLHEETLRLDGARQEELVVVDPGYPDPGAGVSRALPPGVVRAAADLRMPVIHQTAIGVERPMAPWLSFRSDWLRLRGDGIFRSVNVNTPLDGVRPDPAFGNISEIVSTGKSHTDRLTVGLSVRVRERRVFGNLRYQFGRSQNHADNALSLPSDSINPDADWGPAAQDVRHRLFLMGTMPLPWKTRLSVQAQGASSLPYTITTGTDDNGDTVFNDRPPGVGRNSARGAPTWNVNLRLQRTFDLGGTASGTDGAGPIGIGGAPDGPGAIRMGGEGGPTMVIAEGGRSRYRFDVYVQAFNVFNQANLNRFVGNMRSPFFGAATSAAPPRRIELGVTFGF